MNLSDNHGTFAAELERAARDSGRDRGHAEPCELNPDEYETEERGLAFELRRQEFVDRHAERSGFLLWEEDGAADVRTLVLFGVASFVVVGIAVALWHYVIGAAVIYGAFRVLTRETRRRRPRSSFATNAKALAAVYAAWNTRGLVRRNGRPLRVSVPATAGREHLDSDGIPF